MNFGEALRELDGRQPESIPEPSLERIRAVVDLLDHPERTYPSIQITGTNGKTTTARVVTALACAHGLSTGTFISPHLQSVTERVSVCGAPISDQEFAEEYGHLLPFLERVDAGSTLRVTYFETLTALAFLWFADKPIGLGVFEVGLGGTWDATNLARGDVAVLCPIGLDHVKHLGSTVAQIAGEKSGIVKEGRPAVVREQRPEAMEVIAKRAAEVGATMLVEGDAYALTRREPGVGGQVLRVRGVHAAYDDLFLPLFGEQAARNAAASIVALETLLDRVLDDRATRRALRGATSPGRVEVVASHPTVVLDGAHNPDAAVSLADTLREAFHWDRLHLVIGMFEDKDVEAVGAILAPLADAAYVCMNSSIRAASLERVSSAMLAGGAPHPETFDDVASAVAAARAAAGERDLILITGSFYTVADARPLLVGA